MKQKAYIACLGPEGTFSHQAAMRYLALTGKTFESYCPPDLGMVLNSVERGAGALERNDSVSEAIAPAENLIEGTINQTLDFLAHSNNTKIIGEMILEVQQDVIGFSGTKLGNVTKVLSHNQPLAQCASYIKKNMPSAKPELTSSTVDAIEKVSKAQDHQWVAIGNSSVNEHFGLVTLAENVSDVANNQTRFLILSHQKEVDPAMPSEKISIVFSLPKDQPGGLYKIMGLLQHLNLTKIESRPSKDMLGSYYFFIDVQGNYSDPDIQKTLKAVAASTDTFKILGAYKEIK